MRRNWARVSFRKDFWDRYLGRAGLLLVNLLSLSLVTVPEVFVMVNTAQCLSRF